VSESVQGTGAEASKEANKSVAKDNDASLSSRLTAGKDAVVDKKDETSHNTKADVHKGTYLPPFPTPFRALLNRSGMGDTKHILMTSRVC
jgi:hypothetical protein